jgi:hypothetical protein
MSVLTWMFLSVEFLVDLGVLAALVARPNETSSLPKADATAEKNPMPTVRR